MKRLGIVAVAVLTVLFSAWDLSIPRCDAKHTTFRVTVDGVGPLKANFTGILSVDGRVLNLGVQRTPWELTVQEGSIITASLHAISSVRRVRVNVYNHAWSETEPEASAVARAVAFAWARADEGPRWIDTP